MYSIPREPQSHSYSYRLWLLIYWTLKTEPLESLVLLILTGIPWVRASTLGVLPVYGREPIGIQVPR